MRKYIVIFIILFVFYYIFKYCNESNISSNSPKSVTFREDFATNTPSAPVVQSITRNPSTDNATIILTQSGTSTSYRIYLYNHTSRGYETKFANTFTRVGNTVTIVISLTTGVNYWFQVFARDGSSESQASNQMLYIHTLLTDTVTVTPPKPSVTLINNRQANVIWTAPPGSSTLITSSMITRYSVKTYQGSTLIKTQYTVDRLTDLSSSPRFQQAVPTILTITDLSFNTSYTFTVIATNAVGDSPESPQSDPVTPFTVPSAPTLAAVAGNGLVDLSWNAPSSNGRDISNYIIQRSTTSGFATYSTSTETNSTLSKSITSLTNGTLYYFRVYATNLAGIGPFSNVVTVIPFTVPSAPTLTAVPGNGLVDLSWNAPVNNGRDISSYVIQKSIDSMTWDFDSSTNATTRFKRVSGLNNGITYKFRVYAINAAGNGTNSIDISARPVASNFAPTITSVVAGNGQATVNWNHPTNTTGIISYIIERKTNLVDWAVDSLIEFNSIIKSKLVIELSQFTLYSFRMYARYNNGDGIYSNVITTTTLGVITNPSQVGKPSVSVLTNNQATVSWLVPTFNGGSSITGYIVHTYQSTYPNVQGTVPYKTNNLPSTPTTITVTDLSNGIFHTFTVIAKNATLNSDPSIHSDSVRAITVPNQPIISSLTAGNGEATVNWLQDITDGRPVTSYLIQRSTTNASNSTWTDFSANDLDFSKTVTGLINNTTYYFKVSARNNVGTSVPSSVLTVIPYTVPTAPLNLTSRPGNGFVDLSWNPPSSTGGRNITNYKIETKTASTTWTEYSLTNDTKRFEKVTELTNGITYSFKVSAKNIGDYGVSSTEVSAMPVGQPSVPKDVTAILEINTRASISWNEPDNIGAAGSLTYTVTSSPTAGTPVITNRSAIVSNLSPGTSYTFTVTARNSASLSSFALSNSVPTIPVPTIVSATTGDNVGQVRLIWTVPNNTPSTTIYTIENIPTDATIQYNTLIPEQRREAIISGLSNTARTFIVRASNNSNSSIFSQAQSSQVIPRQLALPTGIIVVPGTFSDQAVISWTAPNNAPDTTTITYNISISNQQLAATLQPNGVTSTTVSGLTNNSHSFTVIATYGAYSSQAQSSSFTPTQFVEPTIEAVAGNGTITLTMTKPVNSRLEPSYTVTSTSVLQSQIVVTDSVATIRQLTNGTNYNFNVVAVATNGGYTSNKTITVMPIGPPTVPRNVTATQPTNTQANITWDVPENIGAAEIIRYDVTSYPPAGTPVITNRSAYVPDLSPGTTYTFTVRAINSENLFSEAESTQVTTAATSGGSGGSGGSGESSAPTVPRNVTATLLTNTQANITWDVPENIGAAGSLTYTVTSSPTAGTPVITNRSAIVSNLSPGTSYTFTVIATNNANLTSQEVQSSVSTIPVPTIV